MLASVVNMVKVYLGVSVIYSSYQNYQCVVGSIFLLPGGRLLIYSGTPYLSSSLIFMN